MQGNIIINKLFNQKWKTNSWQDLTWLANTVNFDNEVPWIQLLNNLLETRSCLLWGFCLICKLQRFFLWSYVSCYGSFKTSSINRRFWLAAISCCLRKQEMSSFVFAVLWCVVVGKTAQFILILVHISKHLWF